MSATIRFVQLNIEGSKHLDLVLPFLAAQAPEVATIQELCEPDVARFEELLEMKCFYVPMAIEGGVPTGVGIFSRLPIAASHAVQYGGSEHAELQVYVHGDRALGHASSKFFLAVCDIEKDGETFRIATTHFPVTARGEATDYQREDIKKLLKLLKEEKEFVLTGDFNAPRGGEIFAMLASRYKDNIPPEITTSIDGSIHRAGQLPHMVDGIFSTPGYNVSNVQGHTGVSDHCAFSADIAKLTK